MNTPFPVALMDMARTRLFGLASAFLAIAVLSGCGTTTSYPAPAARTLVVVNNAHTALNAMEVHLLTPTGRRMPLGHVGLNELKSFEVRRKLPAGSYRLEARGARKILSQEFRLDEGDLMEWDLSRNMVRYQGRAAGT